MCYDIVYSCARYVTLRIYYASQSAGVRKPVAARGKKCFIIIITVRCAFVVANENITVQTRFATREDVIIIRYFVHAFTDAAVMRTADILVGVVFVSSVLPNVY